MYINYVTHNSLHFAMATWRDSNLRLSDSKVVEMTSMLLLGIHEVLTFSLQQNENICNISICISLNSGIVYAFGD
jgi:hypothetical protein